MALPLAASLALACASAQTNIAQAAGTGTDASRLDSIRETRIERVDVKPVHQTHAKFHPRLDHNINRYANRSQHMIPISPPRLEEREKLIDEGTDSEKIDAVMLVHHDDRPVDIKTLNGHGKDEHDSKRDEKDREHESRHRTANRHTASKKLKRISERLPSFDGANGDSGGGGEQAGTINGASGPLVGGTIKEFTLGQGSALIAHQQHVAVNTDLGKVHVRPGSVAFVAQIGKSVSVYNLGDVHDGDVHVIVGNQTIAVPVGQHVVLTKETEPKFEKINPVKQIRSRNPASDGTTNGIAIYHAVLISRSASF